MYLHFTLEAELRTLGFNSFAYFSIDKSSLTTPQVISNYPIDWVNEYIDQCLFKRDPVINYAMSRVTPFLWSEASQDHRFDHDIFSSSHQYGIYAGYTVPLHDPFGRFAALSISDNGDLEDFNAAVVQFSGALHCMLAEFHESRPHPPTQKKTSIDSVFNVLDDAECLRQLSKRELETLCLASQGKTYNEISHVLAISERTVKFHIANVVQKMKVVNAKHAIAKAKAKLHSFGYCDSQCVFPSSSPVIVANNATGSSTRFRGT